MPQVRVQVPHSLDHKVAVDRLRRYAEKMQVDFKDHVSHMRENWSDDGVVEFSFRVLGFQVTGTTTIAAFYAEILLQLPLAAYPMRGMIEREIATRLASALAAEG
jgi:hypothetical protein